MTAYHEWKIHFSSLLSHVFVVHIVISNNLLSVSLLTAGPGITDFTTAQRKSSRTLTTLNTKHL